MCVPAPWGEKLKERECVAGARWEKLKERECVCGWRALGEAEGEREYVWLARAAGKDGGGVAATREGVRARVRR
eukprot:2153939-Pleurochrysis_carterae.AAC.1